MSSCWGRSGLFLWAELSFPIVLNEPRFGCKLQDEEGAAVPYLHFALSRYDVALSTYRMVSYRLIGISLL